VGRRDNQALVRNAADPRQVKRAARKERDREAQYLASLRLVLELPAGRLVFATLLRRAGLDRTVYDSSGSSMYFNEGRRNVGLEIKANLIEASEDLYELLEREDRARQRHEAAENDAVHMDTTEETPTNG
jgi:hypothetical protein